ncbi:hypothetical protein [Mycolicibacterium sp. XJ870]
MDWHEHIVYEAPERDYLVQRRYYVDDARWSWVVIGDERKMTITDNIGDVRVRMARLGRKRILAVAEKGPNRTDPWKVRFPAESGRQARVAGRLHLAVGWMLTALYWDSQADESARDFYAPEAVAHRLAMPRPDDRAEYRTDEDYQAAQEEHRAMLKEAGDAMSRIFDGILGNKSDTAPDPQAGV